MNESELIQLALQCGARKSVVIDGRDVALLADFREACRANQCGSYGRCYMCPPDVGEIGALMTEVHHYSRGLLYQTVGMLEDSFDAEGMMAAAADHMRVSQAIQHGIGGWLGSTLHLSCGGCRLCQVCAKAEGMPCRHPAEALPSLEGYGVDVYRTAQKTDLRYINGQNTVTYFGLVLWGA